ncbi:MAG: AAA family ATPase, partial [bacterium]
MDQLHKGLSHAQPFMLVLGAPGAGKTFDVLEACARWGTRAVTRWVDLRTTGVEAVLDTLLRAFEIEVPQQPSRRARIEALARVSGETTRKSGHFIAIVDDAHDVPTAVLAELTRIANEVRDARGELRAILAGHDALESRLADVALQGFAARTGARIRVVGMDVSDARSYLHHVLAHAGVNAEGVFSRKSAREVHAFADGIPGRVDALATESARIAAKAGVTQVAPEHVRAANAALRLRETPPAHKPAATMAAPVATAEATPASPAPAAPAIAQQPVTASVEPTVPADPSPTL